METVIDSDSNDGFGGIVELGFGGVASKTVSDGVSVKAGCGAVFLEDVSG